MAHRQIIAKRLSDLRISSYMSYRKLLEDLYKAVKADIGRYSYLMFAEDLGFPASNCLRLIIIGDRRLTDATATKICKTLDVRNAERRYLFALMRYENARLPLQREPFFQALLEIRKEMIVSQTEQTTLEYWAEWFHPVIREMIAFESFSPDPEWIASQLFHRVLPREIQMSLALLQKLGLIAYDSKLARYVQTGGPVLPDRDVGMLASVRFHQKAIEHAKESITRISETEREINTMTLSLSNDGLTQLRNFVRSLCAEAMAIEKNDKQADRVYQFNIQLFPHTKKRVAGDGDGGNG